MIKIFKLSPILVVMLFTYFTSEAQLTIKAELRPRAEFRNGFKTLKEDGDKPAFFIEQRSRLYFNFKKERFELHLALQDIRIWGGTDQIYKSDPALTNIYEGYIRYHFNDKYSLKFGRQALDYNNARFFGNLDWAQQGRSHDALLFIYDDENTQSQLHVGAAFNQNVFEPAQLFGTFYQNSNYKTMQYAWWNKKLTDANISLLIQNDGRQVQADTSIAYRQTYGMIGDFKLGNVKLDGEVYYQGGKNGGNTDVSAFLLALHATAKAGQIPLTLGFELLSGTSIDDSKDKAFNPLYGTNHKFYGFMDYFYVGNGHGQAPSSSGLMDIFLKANYKTGDKSSLLAFAHVFNSPAKIYDPESGFTESMSSYLGTEIDLVYKLIVSKDAVFNVGYSHMFASTTMETIKGRGDSSKTHNWAWVMFAFKPTLFTTKKDE